MNNNKISKKYIISIIIPIYNKEQYLSECLLSVVNQTMFENIELILVNDGSKDGSEKICLEYKEKYPNIKYIFQENQGVSVARNRGLDVAIGEYVYFIDADDSINDIYIEAAYNNAKLNDSDVVIVANNVGLRNGTLDKIYSLAIWQCFWKKSFLEKYPNIKFVPKLSNGEDSLFTFEYLLFANKVTREYKCIYNYRKSDSSLVTNMHNTKYYIDTIKKWMEELQSFYNINSENKNINQNLLRFLAAQVFYKLIRKNNFSKTEKFEIVLILVNFSVKNNLGFIYFNPKNFIYDYSYLYCLFNIILFFGFLWNKLSLLLRKKNV